MGLLRQRRISHEGSEQAARPIASREGGVVYVCGSAKMTDENV
jgi:hypothetical protein